MTPQEAAATLKKKLADLEKFIRDDVHDIVGTEAVRHYNQSFVNEGATDKALKKWPDVKRRDPSSSWYGFSLGSNSQNPNKKTVETRHASSKKDKNKKKSGSTNFSPTRAKDNILTGNTNELKNSIRYVVAIDRKSTTVLSDKPYSAVHNFGEKSFVFGKKAFTQKARPFIYPSAVLNKAIYDKVAREMKKQGLIK